VSCLYAVRWRSQLLYSLPLPFPQGLCVSGPPCRVKLQSEMYTPVRGDEFSKAETFLTVQGRAHTVEISEASLHVVTSVTGMRWDELFDDLSGQLEHELENEEADLHKEEERMRLGRLTIRDRIAAIHRAEDPQLRRVRYRSRGGELHTVRPLTVGRDWMAGDLDGRPGAQCVVPFGAIDSLIMDREQVECSLNELPDPPALAARLGIAFLLRDLSRRRTALTVDSTTATSTGTIDRVGRDHFDLAVHDPESPRRESAVEHVLLIALDQVLLLRL
jgi:hypothetical protein